MAILDTSKKPYIIDRDERISIGIDLPFRKSDGIGGWFATTSTTIEAIKNSNITANQYADRRELYFKRVVKKSPEKKESLEGWLNRANKYRI